MNFWALTWLAAWYIFSGNQWMKNQVFIVSECNVSNCIKIFKGSHCFLTSIYWPTLMVTPRYLDSCRCWPRWSVATSGKILSSDWLIVQYWSLIGHLSVRWEGKKVGMVKQPGFIRHMTVVGGLRFCTGKYSLLIGWNTKILISDWLSLQCCLVSWLSTMLQWVSLVSIKYHV